MRLGISVNSTYGTDAKTAVDRILDRVRAAEKAGLDSLTFGDHHVQPGYTQNTPILARALAEWGDRPAGCLFLLPLWNPVLVAEHVTTLSGMMAGPFVLQTGIGHGARQFAAMGAATATRGRMLEESVRVIRALFAGEEVTSEPFGIVGATVTPSPAVDVEWWIGAGNTPAPLRRAAQLGDAWYGPPGLTAANAHEPLDQYRLACAEFDRTPRACVRKDVLILEDGGRASELGQSILAAGYRGLGPDQVVFGSPAQVADQLAPFAELGFDEVVIRCMASDQSVALDTIAAAGEVRSLLSGG
jgi:alkanesulfonate monooxygenase SsuD/methylene tetrahydromethanopterin reductase-like flavin-dependent oxidoreductase (luciferase family)